MSVTNSSKKDIQTLALGKTQVVATSRRLTTSSLKTTGFSRWRSTGSRKSLKS